MGWERKREKERNISCLPLTHPQPVAWPETKSNLLPFGLQDDTQPTEPHQLGLFSFLFLSVCGVKIVLPISNVLKVLEARRSTALHHNEKVATVASAPGTGRRVEYKM